MPSKLVLLSWDDSFPGLGIGNQLPSGPVYPSQGLPGGGYPSTGPVYPGGPVDPGFGGGGRPPHVGGGPIYLPVFPFDPTKPVDPDEPEVDPGPVRPGKRFVVKWLACSGLILVPDNTLPETPEPKE